jgi:hypothetical protein
MHNTSLLKKSDEGFELTPIVRLYIFDSVIKLILYLKFELFKH